MRPSFSGSGYDKFPFECQLYSVHPVPLDIRNFHDCGFSITPHSKRSLHQAGTLHRYSNGQRHRLILSGREPAKTELSRQAQNQKTPKRAENHI